VPIFELDAGRPVLVQPMRPAAGTFPTDSTSLVADHLGSLLGEQLFPVSTRTQGADAPHLLAVDAAGQPVVVEVVQVLDNHALVRALRYVGAASRLSSADLARAYHGGPERFATELVAFRENIPVAVAHMAARHAGARLLLLCSEVDESVADAVEFLRRPGGHVEVLQVGVLRGADGRRYVDVSPLVARAPARRAVEPSTLHPVDPSTLRDVAERRDGVERRDGAERRDGVERRVAHEGSAWTLDVPDLPASRGVGEPDPGPTLSPTTSSEPDVAWAAGRTTTPVPAERTQRAERAPTAAFTWTDAAPDDRAYAPVDHDLVDLRSDGLRSDDLRSDDLRSDDLRSDDLAGARTRPRSAADALSTGPVPSAGAAAPSGTFPSVLTVPVGPANLGPPDPEPVLADLGAHLRTSTPLVWFRRRRRQRLTATLRADGLVQLPDGAVFADPGEAAAAAAGIELDVDGWRVWRVGDDEGPTLAEVCVGARAAE
jgi:hypothetical protein